MDQNYSHIPRVTLHLTYFADWATNESSVRSLPLIHCLKSQLSLRFNIWHCRIVLQTRYIPKDQFSARWAKLWKLCQERKVMRMCVYPNTKTKYLHFDNFTKKSMRNSLLIHSLNFDKWNRS